MGRGWEEMRGEARREGKGGREEKGVKGEWRSGEGRGREERRRRRGEEIK